MFGKCPMRRTICAAGAAFGKASEESRENAAAANALRQLIVIVCDLPAIDRAPIFIFWVHPGSFATTRLQRKDSRRRKARIIASNTGIGIFLRRSRIRRTELFAMPKE